MKTAYVNAKLTVPVGSMYLTLDTYFYQGRPGGWLSLGHSIPDGTTDHLISFTPNTALTFVGNVLTLKSPTDTVIVDWNKKTVSWDSPGWSGSAPFEYAGMVIRNDDNSLVNLSYP